MIKTSRSESFQNKSVKRQGDRKFISFIGLQQYYEPEEDQLIDDKEIGCIPNKALTDVRDCSICHKDFDSEESYSKHIIF